MLGYLRTNQLQYYFL